MVKAASGGQTPSRGLRKAAVLGHPISHSLSPVLHNAAYTALGLAGGLSPLGQARQGGSQWVYTAIDVTEDTLPSFVRSLDSTWAGLSLTMPLKLSVAPLLDSLSDMALATGAVNTVLVHAAGPQGDRLVLNGDNTDVYGIVMALAEAADDGGCAVTGTGTNTGALTASGLVPAATIGGDRGTGTDYLVQLGRELGGISSACVLGAGATAASAVAALHCLGCLTPTVFARNLDKIGVVQAVTRHPSMAGLEPSYVDLSQALDHVVTADAVVSTMPAHAGDQLAQKLRQARARPHGVLLDVIYHPRPTALQQAWTDLGGRAVGGERMLLHQAAQQVSLMTGLKAPVEAMDAALTAAL